MPGNGLRIDTTHTSRTAGVVARAATSRAAVAAAANAAATGANSGQTNPAVAQTSNPAAEPIQNDGQPQDDEEPDAEESPLFAPIHSEADIDYSLVYALHTFVATLEGQVSVLKGDSLELLDDSNSYWWLVKNIKTAEIGYIPAENIEMPVERLARLNRQRNVGAAAPTEQDSQLSTRRDSQQRQSQSSASNAGRQSRSSSKPPSMRIQFAENVIEIYADEDDDDEYGDDGNPNENEDPNQDNSQQKNNDQPGYEYNYEEEQPYKPAEAVVATNASNLSQQRPPTAASGRPHTPGFAKSQPTNRSPPRSNTYATNNAQMQQPRAENQSGYSSSPRSTPSRTNQNQNQKQQKEGRGLWGMLQKGLFGKRNRDRDQNSDGSNTPQQDNSPVAFRKVVDDAVAHASASRTPGFNTGSPSGQRAPVYSRESSVGPRAQGGVAGINPAYEAAVAAALASKNTPSPPPPSQSSSSSSLTQSQNAASAEVLNVIRIYRGNIDVDATFKSVPFNETLTSSQLISSALKKFRIHSNINGGIDPRDYYLSVAFMDSQERVLDNSDVVYDVLMALRQKHHLPGVSDMSRNAMQQYVSGSSPRVVAVRLTDDNVFRILINRRPFDAINNNASTLMLIRIAYEGGASGAPGTQISLRQRLMRTISIPRMANGEAVTQIALEIFGVQTQNPSMPQSAGPNAASNHHVLLYVMDGYEVVVPPDAFVYHVIHRAHEQRKDIMFVLRPIAVGIAGAPAATTAAVAPPAANMIPITIASQNAPNVGSLAQMISMAPNQPQMVSMAPNQPQMQYQAPRRPVPQPPTQQNQQQMQQPLQNTPPNIPAKDPQQPIINQNLRIQPRPRSQSSSGMSRISSNSINSISETASTQPAVTTKDSSYVLPEISTGRSTSKTSSLATEVLMAASLVSAGTETQPATSTSQPPQPRRNNSDTLSRSISANQLSEALLKISHEDVSGTDSSQPKTLVSAQQISNNMTVASSAPGRSGSDQEMNAAKSVQVVGGDFSILPTVRQSTLYAGSTGSRPRTPSSTTPEPRASAASPQQSHHHSNVASGQYISRNDTIVPTVMRPRNRAEPMAGQMQGSAHPSYGVRGSLYDRRQPQRQISGDNQTEVGLFRSRSNPAMNTPTSVSSVTAANMMESPMHDLKAIEYEDNSAAANTSVLSAGNTSTLSSTASLSENFELMVDYLDEILKESTDHLRIQQLERNLNIEPADRSLSAVEKLKRRSFGRVAAVSDSNMSRTATIVPGMAHKPTTESSPLRPIVPRSSSMTDKLNASMDAPNDSVLQQFLPSSNSPSPAAPGFPQAVAATAVPITSKSALRDLFKDIEMDIEHILEKSIVRDSDRRRSVRMSFSNNHSMLRSPRTMRAASVAESTDTATPAAANAYADRRTGRSSSSSMASSSSSKRSLPREPSAGSIGSLTGASRPRSRTNSNDVNNVYDNQDGQGEYDEEEIDILYRQFKTTSQEIDRLESALASILDKALSVVPLPSPSMTFVDGNETGANDGADRRISVGTYESFR